MLSITNDMNTYRRQNHESSRGFFNFMALAFFIGLIVTGALGAPIAVPIIAAVISAGFVSQEAFYRGNIYNRLGGGIQTTRQDYYPYHVSYKDSGQYQLWNLYIDLPSAVKKDIPKVSVDDIASFSTSEVSQGLAKMKSLKSNYERHIEKMGSTKGMGFLHALEDTDALYAEPARPAIGTRQQAPRIKTKTRKGFWQ